MLATSEHVGTCRTSLGPVPGNGHERALQIKVQISLQMPVLVVLHLKSLRNAMHALRRLVDHFKEAGVDCCDQTDGN
jgi:hypothetical protein